MSPPRASHVVFLVVAGVWLGLRVPGAIGRIAQQDVAANLGALRSAWQTTAAERIARGLRLDPVLVAAIDKELSPSGTLVVFSPHRGRAAETELGFLRARLAVWLYPRRAVATADTAEIGRRLAGGAGDLLVLDLSGAEGEQPPWGGGHRFEEIARAGWLRLWRPREGGR